MSVPQKKSLMQRLIECSILYFLDAKFLMLLGWKINSNIKFSNMNTFWKTSNLTSNNNLGINLRPLFLETSINPGKLCFFLLSFTGKNSSSSINYSSILNVIRKNFSSKAHTSVSIIRPDIKKIMQLQLGKNLASSHDKK